MWLKCSSLMVNFHEWGVSSYKWAKKAVSWDGIYQGEDAVKIIEMTTSNWKYGLNLVDKHQWVWIEFPKLKVLLWLKCYQTAALHIAEKLFREEINQSVWQNALLSYFKKLYQYPPLHSVSTHQYPESTLHQQRDTTQWRLSWWLTLF